MCGISGMINSNNNLISKSIFQKMNDIIIHRGPDGFGYYYGSNFALGHRRLSILDLSKRGHQPMTYMDKYTIVFNGEIYNYLELKDTLLKDNYIFNSCTDTEVILASYDKWGEKCVEYFNGMWSFAIFDKKKNKIFCSRDRLGIKPFYYTRINNIFTFGSEIKQFSVLKDWKARINYFRAYDFIVYGMLDYMDETLFDGVYQLRGGHNLIYDLSSHEWNIYEWYNLKNNISHIDMSFKKACNHFRELFEDSVRLRLRSDVKVGSCLSGGLDSSSIVCVLNNLLKNENRSDKQETVSSCFEIKKYDEQEYIDEVVDKTQVISHKVFPKFNDLFTNVDKITWLQDEPFGSTSIFAQWNVFKTAKLKGLKVMLDGQGADELLAGYPVFYSAFFNGLVDKCNTENLKNEVDSFKNMLGYSDEQIENYLSRNIDPHNTKKKTIGTPIKEMQNLLRQDFKEKYCGKLLEELRKNSTSIQQLSIKLLLHTSVPILLRYEDRNSMGHSIESRVPFLDYRLLEFVLGLPDNYKINEGKRKYILRESMKDILPKKITNRYDKMGFVTPEEVWVRENHDIFRLELQKTCEYFDTLFDKQKVLNWYDNLISSNKPIDFRIWRILSLGRWAKIFKVSM